MKHFSISAVAATGRGGGGGAPAAAAAVAAAAAAAVAAASPAGTGMATAASTATTTALDALWWQMRRGCSPSATVRMCSFWMSSTVPMVRPAALASARQSGRAGVWKGAMYVTCAWLTLDSSSLREAACSTVGRSQAANTASPPLMPNGVSVMGWLPSAIFFRSASATPPAACTTRYVNRWPSPSATNRYGTPSSDSRRAERDWMSPPSASLATSRMPLPLPPPTGSATRCTLMSVHRPTAARLAMCAAAAAPPAGVASTSMPPSAAAAAAAAAVASGFMLKHDTSCGMARVARQARVRVATSSSRYASRPPASANSTCEPQAAATVMRLPAVAGCAAGDHADTAARPAAASARRTAVAVTCSARPPASVAHRSDGARRSNPGAASTSSSAVPSIARMRVSSAYDVARYLSHPPPLSPPLLLPSRSAHRPVMPGNSTTACSSTPMPLRTMRREPSRPTPLAVTTCPCPCRSRSITVMSTTGAIHA